MVPPQSAEIASFTFDYAAGVVVGERGFRVEVIWFWFCWVAGVRGQWVTVDFVGWGVTANGENGFIVVLWLRLLGVVWR